MKAPPDSGPGEMGVKGEEPTERTYLIMHAVKETEKSGFSVIKFVIGAMLTILMVMMMVHWYKEFKRNQGDDSALPTWVTLPSDPTSHVWAECSRVVMELEDCVEDQGPQYPQHLQTVYLGSTKGPEVWHYPNDELKMRDKEHNPHTILHTENSWAKWIWHDCGDGFVCLESVKFPNHYLYQATISTFGFKVSKSVTKDQSRLKITQKRVSSRGVYVVLVDEKFYTLGLTKGIPVYLYIPPRCEGYKKVVDSANPSSHSMVYKFKYIQGVTRTKTSLTWIAKDIRTEVVSGIVSASANGTFSNIWKNEKLIAMSGTRMQQSSTEIPPGKRLVVWQKMATYARYEWRSGTSFMKCIIEKVTVN